MSRRLILIAASGLAISVASLSVVHSMTNNLPDEASAALTKFLASKHVTVQFDDDQRFGACPSGATAEDASPSQRSLTWPSGETELSVSIPAKVHYQPNAPRGVSATGRADTLAHLKIENGNITYDCSWTRKGRLDDMMPDVTIGGAEIDTFSVSGIGKIDLADVHQPNLTVKISGTGSVDGTGAADRLDIDISGAGKIDLGALRAKTAKIHMSGAGEAKLAVIDDAEVHISGVGRVRWVETPVHVDSHISGVGSVGSIEK